MALCQQRCRQKDKEVEPDVGHDEGQFEAGKLPGAALETQQCEEDGLYGVDGHHGGHDAQVFGVAAVVEQVGDGGGEQEDGQQEECGRGAHHHGGGREDTLALLFVLVGEVEKGGFHAKGEQHQEQGSVGVDIGNDSVAAASRRNLVGVERHQQVVQKTAHDVGDNG